jgi:hypothetical protein
MDCDSPTPHASPRGCERVAANFTRITGRPLPCTCPCANEFGLFAAFLAGDEPVVACFTGSGTTTVTGPGGQFVAVQTDPPPNCGVGSMAPFLPLTDAEAQLCRSLLLAVAAAQGFNCQGE